ncbi:MAG TPA: hypothetical protein VEA15_07630 [Caulobacteraceae bacterium]|nr:hypothetical protein [Caulobacteraceae bacterium]
MSITIANRMLQSPGDLSERCRLVLAFIDGGVEWLRWAILDPVARYQFGDESRMLTGVQEGLHASRFALLRELQVLISPAKLMTLNDGDLRILARAELKERDVKSTHHTHRLLQAHGILSQGDLDKGTAWLGELGFADAPVFQFMGLEDRKAIYDLFRDYPRQDDEDLELERQAGLFALEQGRTPREFADYFRVYLTLSERIGSAKVQGRARHAEAAVHALAPLLLGALNCPEVPGLVAPKQVAEAVELWLMWGRSIGFARISAGVREIVSHTAYAGETGQAARAFVEHYVAESQRLLSAAPVHRGLMAQDGATCTFPIEGRRHEAELQLDPAGIISLSWFRARPDQETSANGRAARKLENAS